MTPGTQVIGARSRAMGETCDNRGMLLSGRAASARRIPTFPSGWAEHPFWHWNCAPLAGRVHRTGLLHHHVRRLPADARRPDTAEVSPA